MNTNTPFAEPANQASSSTTYLKVVEDGFDVPRMSTQQSVETIVERRREGRVPIHSEGTLRSVRPPYPEKVKVIVLDVSKHGIRARLQRFVDVGWQVQLSMGNAVVFGQIRHCTRSSSGEYIVGIAIQAFVPTRALTGKTILEY